MSEINSPFPIISVEGSPYECGIQHGSKARELIEYSVATYRETLSSLLGLDWDGVVKKAFQFLPAIEAYDPTSIEEMNGIAEGAGRKFEDILVLNARSELVFLARVGGESELKARPAEGCTVLAATPEATESGHMLVGQNIDWLDIAQKAYILLKKRRSNMLNCVTLLEAGIVGKTGFNEKGIVSFGNALVTDMMRPGVPSQIILNKLLNAHSVAEAIQIFLTPQRAASINRLIASAEGLCVDVEASPDNYSFVFPEKGVLAHTNHFLGNNPHIRDVEPHLFPNTVTRRYMAEKFLKEERGRINKESFKKIFRNHVDKPNSLCMHKDKYRYEGKEGVHTVASIILDANTLELDIAKGPPCENEYVTIDFSDIVDRNSQNQDKTMIR